MEGGGVGVAEQRGDPADEGRLGMKGGPNVRGGETKNETGPAGTT